MLRCERSSNGVLLPHQRSVTTSSAAHGGQSKIRRKVGSSGSGVLKHSGNRGWGTTVKWLSGLSLCVCVPTCFAGCLFKAFLFPSRALLK